MPWKCPKCDRTIIRENAVHQCIRKSPDDLFLRKDPVIHLLFRKLHKKLSTWKSVEGSATKNCIVYVAKTSFLIIRPMKSALDIKFYLSEATEDFPVYKTEPWGKRFAHHIRLFEESDLDDAVWSFLKRSYQEDLSAASR